MLAIAKSDSSAHRRYVVRTMAFMSGYVAINVAAIFGAFDDIGSPVAAWTLALAVSARTARAEAPTTNNDAEARHTARRVERATK